MAQVKVFQGGNIARDGRIGEKQRAADFGQSAVAIGLQTIGKVTADFAERADALDDVRAKTEANRLAIEHAKAAQGIGQGVKQAQGDYATPAYQSGLGELDKATKDVLGRASPRARKLLETEFASKNLSLQDDWETHAFGQEREAHGASLKARMSTAIEGALDLDDEGAAMGALQGADVNGVIEEQAKFYGWSPEVRKAEALKIKSDFVKTRAVRKASGENGSAQAAIDYATEHRGDLSGDDYNSIVGTYDNAALNERALGEAWGDDKSSPAAVVEKPAADAPPEQGPAKRLDPRAFFNQFTVTHEGRAYVTDSNGRGVKFGINEEYNPGVDVKNLSQDGAARIFEARYFKRSGADKLPPALAAAHVDTFYLNERQAGRILRESGGDVDKYLGLRNNFLNGLVAQNPAKFAKYQKGWQNRTNALGQYADHLGGDGTAAPIAITPDTSLTDVRAKVFDRTDISMRYKRALLDAYKDKQSFLIQGRNQERDQAHDGLSMEVAKLGDGFTNINQLDQNLLGKADPSVVAGLINSARDHVQATPPPPAVLDQMAILEVTDPQKFASAEYRKEVLSKGLPKAYLNNFMERQRQVAQNLAHPKAIDPIADGSLWTVARPAFEASGLLLDTLESKGGVNRPKERVEDSQRKVKALGFLRDNMTRWIQSNPGKKPDDGIIRTWVGDALRKNQLGGRLFEMDDHHIYEGIAQPERIRIQRQFIQAQPGWQNKPVAERIIDVVAAFRDRSARVGIAR